MKSLRDQFESRLRKIASDLSLDEALHLGGSVNHVEDGVVRILGLSGVSYEELVTFDGGAIGMAYDIGRTEVAAVLLHEELSVRAGSGVRRLHRLPAVPVGHSLLGRVINPLGQPLDQRPPPEGPLWPMFRPAPSLIERDAVSRPLQTGLMVIDSAIPIGRGQRQLIIGDRNVGKSAIAMDIVAAQASGDVYCVYVVIGQPMSRVLALKETLDLAGALNNTVIVASEAADSPGLQYLAPYAGATVAEWFREQGHDALVVFDDLTKHADAYRGLALLVGRPPGREAYPGDIFYLHAELLERATPLSSKHGGGSVTAFPIVETTDGDIAAYIPTNLISITDGQIYLDRARFEKNLRPAVDIGRSVSRIGGVAQTALLRQAAQNLRIMMSRFEELEALTRVGLDVDPKTVEAVRRGQLMREVLRQGRFQPRSPTEQVLALTSITSELVGSIAPDVTSATLWTAVRTALRNHPGDDDDLSSALWAQRRASVQSSITEPTEESAE